MALKSETYALQMQAPRVSDWGMQNQDIADTHFTLTVRGKIGKWVGERCAAFEVIGLDGATHIVNIMTDTEEQDAAIKRIYEAAVAQWGETHCVVQMYLNGNGAWYLLYAQIGNVI